MAFVRSSKFRHVFGKCERKENCYEDIRITKSAWESTYCAVNPKFLAIVLDSAGGGAFLVLPLGKTGRIDKDHPVVGGHKAAVLDIGWNPFNDNMIASCSEDCTIKVWEIPDGGVESSLTTDDALCSLEHHQKKVGIIKWHPTAENILFSAAADFSICIWNLDDGTVIAETVLPELPLSACWNWIGNKIVTTCKDKKLRVFNGRTLDVLHEAKGHEGAKPSHAIFLKNDKIFTTGFSKRSDRQYALFSSSLKEELMEDMDTSNGVIFPFYDPDNSLVYLVGKGDTVIRYFEVTDTEVHYLAMFQSTDPQKGMGMMPKRGVNVNEHEITRFYKLVSNGCQVIPMTVPRKSELYQADIYPDTASNEPTLTADEWIEGKDSEPNMMSMQQFFKGVEKAAGGGLKKGGGGLKGGLKKKPADAKPVVAKVVKPATPVATPTPKPVEKKEPEKPKPTPVREPERPKPAPVEKPVEKPSAPAGDAKPSIVNSKPQAAAEPVITQEQLDTILSDLRKVKIIVKGHEKRIKDLEDKLASYEEAESGDSGQDQEV